MSNKNQRNEAGKEKDFAQDTDREVRTAAEAKPEESLYVYAGNSLPKGALQQFSVFKNGLPVAVQERIKECPAIGQLMVPISELAETRKNLSVVGSREHAFNAQIQSYVRGGK